MAGRRYSTSRKHPSQKALVTLDVLEPLKRLGKRFETPLVAAGADLSQLRNEFLEMLQYAISLISLATLDYQTVWWRLFHALMLASVTAP